MLTTIKRYFWVIFLLAACSPGPAGTTAAPTVVDVNAISTQAVMTAAAQMTKAAAPTPAALPTETITPRPTRTDSPTRTPLPPFVMNGLHTIYSIKGNLYAQESGGQPIQITHSGMDYAMLLSDDNQMVVFSRESTIFSINIDGSKEQALINSDLLIALGLGYDKSTELHDLALAPGAHQIIFDTHQLRGPKGGDVLPQPNNDLLIVDIDRAKITRLLAPGQAGYFQVSPNGKLIAVQTVGHIDIINLKGQFIHTNLVKYPEDDDHVWMPLSWTGESNQLIVMLPLPSNENLDNSGWPLLRSAWKYSLNGSKPVETRLNPAPMGQAFGTSPDGNWIAYTYYASGKTGGDGKFGIYLGNLRTGISQLLYSIPAELGEIPAYYYWNSVSTYFIVGGQLGIYIGDIYGETTKFRGVNFNGWLDTTHYLYDENITGEIGTDTKVSVIQPPDHFSLRDLTPLIYVLLKP